MIKIKRISTTENKQLVVKLLICQDCRGSTRVTYLKNNKRSIGNHNIEIAKFQEKHIDCKDRLR